MSRGPFEGQLDSLITAVVNADPIVLDTLAGNGQFTVFAPTDAAFAALGLTPEAIVGLASTAEGQALLTDVPAANGIIQVVDTVLLP